MWDVMGYDSLYVVRKSMYYNDIQIPPNGRGGIDLRAAATTLSRLRCRLAAQTSPVRRPFESPPLPSVRWRFTDGVALGSLARM